MAVTHNVIDLLLQRMHQLPQDVQRIISLASCMGHVFDLQTLSIISEQSLSSTAHQLWPLIEARFIKPLREDYKLAQALAETMLEPADLTEKIAYQFVHYYQRILG
jgi:predicted ATPase